MSDSNVSSIRRAQFYAFLWGWAAGVSMALWLT